MKIWEKILIIAIIAVCGVIAGFCWGYSKMYVKCSDKPEVIHHYHTEYVYDTITDVQYKNKYINRYDTAYLTCIDTVVDSVLVEIPIYQYHFDTAGVKATVSGFNVTMDSLEVETKIITDSVLVPYEERKLRFGFGFAIGFGFIYGK